MTTPATPGTASEPASASGTRPRREDVLSGRTGYVGRRRPLLRLVDRGLDLASGLLGQRRQLDRLAALLPRQRVLALAIYSDERAAVLEQAVSELAATRHSLTVRLAATGAGSPALARLTVVRGARGGKFENVNRLLDESPSWGEFDWIVVLDDDVALPPRFLDRLVAACVGLRFDLAQPALSRSSHGAWPVTRRRLPLARTTRFVEIGPVTVFSRRAAGALMPFPALRYGWGLELHWSALAARHHLRLGVVDALPVSHELAPVARSYPAERAIAEALDFLAERPFVPSRRAAVTLARHFRMPRPEAVKRAAALR